MLYVMTWFRLLLFSIFVANSVWRGGVPGDFVRLSWGQHGLQIWLCHRQMCPSLCPWMSVGLMCIVCRVGGRGYDRLHDDGL